MVLFNIHKRRLVNGSVVIPLSKPESACLQLLMAHENEVVSRDALLACWCSEKGVVVTDNSVRVTLHNLRKDFARAGIPTSALTTLVGKGYRLESGHLRMHSGSEVIQVEPSVSPSEFNSDSDG